MSIFTPVDVRGPDARRKQLLQKLMGQAQEARGAASGVPMPTHMGSVLGASGRTFKNATDFRGVPKVNVTQGANIIPSILARLGAAGTSYPAEQSPGPGRSIGSPTPVGPPTQHGYEPVTSAPHVNDPTPPQPGQSGPPIFGNTLGPDAGPTPFTPTPPAPGNTFSPPVNDRVPLGGDMYYDPFIDAVLRGMHAVGRGN